MAAFSFLLKLAEKQIRRTANGALLLLDCPRALPHNVSLLAQHLWNVQIRRKGLLVLERSGGLGDFACLLASVPGLRDRHPYSWLVVICPPGCWQLAAASGLADASADAQGFYHQFLNRTCSPSRYYRPRLPDEEDPPRPRALHLIDEFARAVGVSPNLLSVRFSAPKRVRRRIVRRLRMINPGQRPVIVLHPGPSWQVREWPSQRWRELAELISARTSAVMIKIGADLDSMQQARPASPIPGVVNWVNKLDVIEIVALLEQARAFVGIDSGPLHIAGVLGVPSVALFGPTRGQLFLQPRAHAVILTSGVSCLGCHHRSAGPLHWRTGCPHDIACMREMEAEEVFAALAAQMGEVTADCRQPVPTPRIRRGSR